MRTNKKRLMWKSNTSKRNIEFVCFFPKCFYLIMYLGDTGVFVMALRKSGMIYLKNSFKNGIDAVKTVGTSSPKEIRRGSSLTYRFSFHSFSMCICLFMHMSSMIRLVYSNFICAHCFLCTLCRIISICLCVNVCMLVCLISIFSTSERSKQSEHAFQNWDKVSRIFIFWHKSK